jgi:hypothetical protein
VAGKERHPCRRPEEVRRLYDGATRLAPGLYRTAAGHLLFNVTEVLAACGVEDTDENRKLAEQELAALSRELGIRPVRLGGGGR